MLVPVRLEHAEHDIVDAERFNAAPEDNFECAIHDDSTLPASASRP